MLNIYFRSKSQIISVFLSIALVIMICTGLSDKVLAQTSSNSQQVRKIALPLVVANRFEIDPKQRELFLNLATAAIAPTRAEPGCISYGFYEQPTAANSFIYYEEWRDRTALVEHLQKPYVLPLFAKFPEVLKGNLVVRVYTTSSVADELPTSI